MNIPEVIFKTRIGDNQNLGGGCSIGGKWKDISTKELFDNKNNSIVWSGKNINASRLASGIYFISIDDGHKKIQEKITLIR